ncbi:hypothetical protein ABTA89_19905, partial [Acinetobacter baumannii]
MLKLLSKPLLDYRKLGWVVKMSMQRNGVLIVLSASMSVALAPPHVMAATIKDPDWKVNLTTEVQKGVLNFKGS